MRRPISILVSIPVSIPALILAVWSAAMTAEARPVHTLLDFAALDGWAEDDPAPAFEAFLETCRDLRDPEWEGLCKVARTGPDPRTFFEAFFTPVLIEDGDPMLFTAYFEPELRGSLTRGGDYQWPLYRLPDEARGDRIWATRRQIEEEGLMEGRGLEIAWIDDPVDVFFLQIQGSGRVRLPDGSRIRVGYGGSNGHEYRSVGRELVRRGTFEPHQVSADVIRNWVRDNPEEGVELLRHNSSYVFFREVNQVPPEKGPLGAMNRSITTLRSVAVDPAYTPLGAPVWIEKAGAEPMKRLMIAQDTGSAIKGAQRADIFFGTGREAGRAAGRIRDAGRMVVLLPTHIATGLVPEEDQ
ncbi:MAG: murein transglycosylase A [Shimia sp.]